MDTNLASNLVIILPLDASRAYSRGSGCCGGGRGGGRGWGGLCRGSGGSRSRFRCLGEHSLEVGQIAAYRGLQVALLGIGNHGCDIGEGSRTLVDAVGQRDEPNQCGHQQRHIRQPDSHQGWVVQPEDVVEATPQEPHRKYTEDIHQDTGTRWRTVRFRQDTPNEVNRSLDKSHNLSPIYGNGSYSFWSGFGLGCNSSSS